jgi:hypothetical protein
MLHFHVASNRTNSDGLAVHFGLTPMSTSSCTVKKGKARLVLLHRSTSQTNGATVADCPNETHVRQMVRPSILDSHRRPSPRIHSLFVRWFGRPFWTPAKVHPQIPGIHSKESSTCTAASQREPKPMGRQYQTARMKLVFIISVSVSIVVNT